MIKILTFTLLIISQLSFAKETLQSCVQSAQDYKSKITPAKKISTECFSLIEQTRDHINEDNSSDNFIEFTGYKNILYTKIYQLNNQDEIVLASQRITAGHETELKDIQALDFNEGDAKVYVLNKKENKTQVLEFFYNMTGNLSPTRMFSTSDTEGATNLKVHQENKEIYLISKDFAWIKVFNKDADPRGKRAENSTDLLRSINGSATDLISPQDIAVTKSEIFILDSDRILVYKLNANGSAAPIRTIAGNNTNLSNSIRMDINSNNELEVINANGSKLLFSISGNGNISPL